jgi:hypothetical protein
MTEYIPDDGVVKALTAMLDPEQYPEFAAISQNSIKIGCCLRMRTNKEGELQECKGEPVVTKRIGAAERLYSQVDAIIIVDAYTWQSGNERQALALLHRGLSRLQIESEDGVAKCKARKPDVVEYSGTVKRFKEASFCYDSLCEMFHFVTESVSGQLETISQEETPVESADREQVVETV